MDDGVITSARVEEWNMRRKNEGRKEGMKHWLEEPMPREQDRRNEREPEIVLPDGVWLMWWCGGADLWTFSAAGEGT